MSYSSEILADTPRAWYRCQEVSGFIQDSSGNARHATASPGGNNAGYHQVSPITSDAGDYSINFSTSTNFTVPDVAGLDLGDTFTLEAWVKLAAQTNFDNRYILSKGANAYSMWVNDTPGSLALVAPTVGVSCTATSAFPDTTNFHHCVITKTGATVHLYMDNVDVTGAYTPNTYADTATALFIGSSRVSDAFVSATVDEIAVYATALSSTRVGAHYTAALGGAGGGPAGGTMTMLGVG